MREGEGGEREAGGGNGREREGWRGKEGGWRGGRLWRLIIHRSRTRKLVEGLQSYSLPPSHRNTDGSETVESLV
jgi:hypothetical protein